MNTEGKWNGPGSPEGERREMKDEARGAAEKARSQVRSLADTGREELAEQIGGLGRALHKVGETLREEEQGQVARYGELLGDQAERVARFLREHDADDLVGAVEDFARRQPLVFLGGCLLAGVAIGRFFKASPSESEETPMPLGVAGGERESRDEPSVETGSAYREAVVTTPEAPVGGMGGGVEAGSSIETTPIATPIVGPDREGEER